MSRYLPGTIYNCRWVVVSNIFDFHPYLGKVPNLTSIFFKGVVQPPTSAVISLRLQLLTLGPHFPMDPTKVPQKVAFRFREMGPRRFQGNLGEILFHLTRCTASVYGKRVGYVIYAIFHGSYPRHPNEYLLNGV